ncbi:MAG TPA: Gfo/Idh/MocA family oxidoreductase [bacterium]|nr:Gfo/Idh/MocA family oxidoreductase [bacterium]
MANKNFAIMGVGGYIAPRHLNAIKETGNNLVAALDINDSVGILDKYFFNADFFTEFERFDRHLEKLKAKGINIDYISICTPNYLHDAHIRFSMRIGADAICEKPLVLNPWNLDALEELEQKYNQKVYCILQLRCHPAIIALKEKIENQKKEKKIKKYKIKLKYITPSGNWYHYSWKGKLEKSGGIVTNIGIHFFDMLIWIFGDCKYYNVYNMTDKKASGILELENASVEWELSIDYQDLPKDCSKSTFRLITIDDEILEFSDGFTDLHTEIYRYILSGCGFGIADCRKSINLVYNIRNFKPNKIE